MGKTVGRVKKFGGKQTFLVRAGVETRLDTAGGRPHVTGLTKKVGMELTFL